MPPDPVDRSTQGHEVGRNRGQTAPSNGAIMLTVVRIAAAPDGRRETSVGEAVGIPHRETLGEFNWSSQHLDDEVLRWRNGNGDGQTGLVDLRCVRLAGRQ